jgi:hypothetical protein
MVIPPSAPLRFGRQVGGLPRHGQRSLGCGSGSTSAPFQNVSCGSLRPFPLHAARVRVRSAGEHCLSTWPRSGSCELRSRPTCQQTEGSPEPAEGPAQRGLPRHGQRSLGCGSGSNSAPFYSVSCSSLRPFPLHAARVRVRGALLFGYFLLAAQEKVTSRRAAPGF